MTINISPKKIKEGFSYKIRLASGEEIIGEYLGKKSDKTHLFLTNDKKQISYSLDYLIRAESITLEK